MPRTKMSPEEREAKRRERVRHSFSNAAYSHYDPSVTGYGSPDEWASTIEHLCAGLGRIVHRTVKVPADLELLGLTGMPEDISGLKSAFRKQTFVYHPDHGGTNEQFIALMKAFERLCKAYKR